MNKHDDWSTFQVCKMVVRIILNLDQMSQQYFKTPNRRIELTEIDFAIFSVKNKHLK